MPGRILNGSILNYVLHTPLLRVPELDNIVGCKVYLNSEVFQITGVCQVSCRI